MAPAPRFLRTWRGTAGIRTSGAQRGTFLDNGGAPDRRTRRSGYPERWGICDADKGVRGCLKGGRFDFSLRSDP